MQGEGDGAEQRGAKRGEASVAQRKPPKRRPSREARAIGLSSVAPSEVRRARRSVAARKPPMLPKRRPAREAKARG